jgi:hypothetical protein
LVRLREFSANGEIAKRPFLTIRDERKTDSHYEGIKDAVWDAARGALLLTNGTVVTSFPIASRLDEMRRDLTQTPATEPSAAKPSDLPVEDGLMAFARRIVRGRP